MDSSTSFGFGLAICIIMMWIGFILAIASRAVLKGDLTSRDNYRPIQPKFVKKLSYEEKDAINRHYAKYLLVCSVVIMIGGIVALLLSIAGLFDYALIGLNMVFVPIILLIILAYHSAHKIAKAKETSAAK